MKKAVTFAILTLLFGIPYLGNSAGTSKPAVQTGQAVTSAPAAPTSSPSTQPVTSTQTATAAPASSPAKTSTSTTLDATTSPLTVTSTPVSASPLLPSVTVISAPAASCGDPFHRHLEHRRVFPGQLDTDVTDHRRRPGLGGGFSAWEGEREELLGLPGKGKQIERAGERLDNLRVRLQQEKGGGLEFADQLQGSGRRQSQGREQRLLHNNQPNGAADSGSNLAKGPVQRGAQLESSGERLQDNKGQELHRLNEWSEPRGLTNK